MDDETNWLFSTGEPTWANACVGHNGNPDMNRYARGFSKAANALISWVVCEEDSELIDELIYPICFNMRHSIELRLKDSILKLDKLIGQTDRGNKSGVNVKTGHDIGNLWKAFKVASASFDKRITEVNERIDPLLKQIANRDPTGQTFRYPFGNDNNKNLADVGNINVVKLKRAFSYLERQMDDLHRVVDFLIEEYALDTYTRKSSRAVVFEIAAQLPKRHLWRDDSFSRTKEFLRVKYEIKNTEISKVIKLIEKNYEASSMIGLDISLLGIEEDKLIFLIRKYIEFNPRCAVPLDERELDVISSNEISDDSIVQSIEKSFEIQKFCKENFDVETAAAINALFYFSNFLLFYFYSSLEEFSENYVKRYSIELNNYNRNHDVALDEFIHVFKKTNFLNGIITGLYLLRKNELISRIIDDFSLHGCFVVEDKVVRDEFYTYHNALCGYGLNEI